jgi:hypothetical protein
VRRNAQDSETLSFEPRGARGIRGRGPVVHLAADLHDQARGEAREVDDVRSKQSLAAELEAFHLIGA